MKAEQYCRRLLDLGEAAETKARQLLEEMKLSAPETPL